MPTNAINFIKRPRHDTRKKFLSYSARGLRSRQREEERERERSVRVLEIVIPGVSEKGTLGQVDERTDGQTDGRTDGETDVRARRLCDRIALA